MRTKTLVLTALLGIAASPLFAQTNVYSVNAVGYVQQVYQPGVLQMIANPLNTTNNSIGSVLNNAVPNLTQIFKWNGSTFDIAARIRGSWDHPEFTLNPGEGCFIQLGGSVPYTNTWVGEVMQGNLTNLTTTNSGYYVVSSMVPQTSDADSLGLTASLQNQDAVYEFDSVNNVYQIWSRVRGAWVDPLGGGTAPTITVAQSFFLFTGGVNNGARSWTRTFSVNN
jgi:hypothetical protein